MGCHEYSLVQLGLHDCDTDLFLTGADKRINIIPVLVCAKFNTPVATLLSPSVAFSLFSNFLLSAP